MKTEHKYSFDVLKLVAIAIIVLHHYQQLTQIRFPGGINWYGEDFSWSNLVELFFIISGYFAYKSEKAMESRSLTFSSFFLRKYLRFLPMLILCGLICLLVQWAYGKISSNYTLPYTPWSVFSSLLGFERWIDGARMVNNPMWYVSVLLLCFVLLFLVTYLARKAHFPSYLAYGVMVAMGLIMRAVCLKYAVSIPFVNLSIARGILCFFLGLLIALTLNHSSVAAFVTKKNTAFLFATIAVVGSVAFFVAKPSFITGSIDGTYYTLCFVIYPALMVICESPIMRKVFNVRPFRNIGGIAYNMYMWHVTLIYICLIAFDIFGTPTQDAGAMYIFLLGCFLFAAISYKLIDQPLSRLVSTRIEKQSALEISKESSHLGIAIE